MSLDRNIANIRKCSRTEVERGVLRLLRHSVNDKKTIKLNRSKSQDILAIMHSLSRKIDNLEKELLKNTENHND